MAVPSSSSWIDDTDPADGLGRVTYETDAVASLLPVALGLAGVYVGLLAVGPFALPGSSGPLTTTATAVAALVSGIIAVLAARGRIGTSSAHPVLALLVITSSLTALCHLVDTGTMRESLPFLLLAVGVGAVLLHRIWFLACLAVVWAAYVVGTGLVVSQVPEWAFWTFYLAVASVLGGVVHLLRRRSLGIAQRAVDRALRAATEDAATGLANRRGLALLGREVVAVARRHNDAVHCSFIDVDGLKGVNDRFGHEAGDDVIAAVAEALRRTSRESDVVARWGGDEFVLVGLGAGVPPIDLEHRVQAFLRRDPGLSEHLAGVRISVGRSMLEPWDAGDLDNLLWTADRDMYVRRALKARTVPPVVTFDRTLGDDQA